MIRGACKYQLNLSLCARAVPKVTPQVTVTRPFFNFKSKARKMAGHQAVYATDEVL